MSKLANLKMGMPSVSLSAIPGMATVGKLFAKIGLPAALQPLLTGIGPLALVVVLVVLNIVVFFSGSSVDDEKTIWDGPLMTEKLYQLPDPATAKIINPGIRITRKKTVETQQLVPPSDATATAISTPSSTASEDKEDVVYGKKKYIVQVGQFLTDSGVDSLVKNMQDRGYYPKVSVIQQKSYLNNVQAGPYRSVEAAREAEVKLRANGKDLKVETSDEGYVISLSKTAKLSTALANMEKYDMMGIAPLRLVKAAKFKPVKSVYMGPYNSEAKAEEVKTRMVGISLAIPLVQEWKEDEEE
ncbi:MAG: SPOR domain-containing protein [Magnetococcales bacterium]|nr:SPOR domain-containing protein [Magnetococcales bacterium]